MEALHLSAACRGYLFDKVWHVVSQEEWDAIERSGKSTLEDYMEPRKYPEPVHGAIHLMIDRPGKTEPGTSPVQENYVHPYKATDHTGNIWNHTHDEYLYRMRTKGYAFWYISDALRRPESAIRARFRKLDQVRIDEAAKFVYKPRKNRK